MKKKITKKKIKKKKKKKEIERESERERERERQRERESIILRIISISYYCNVYDKFCFVAKSQISGHLINNVFTTKELQPFGVTGNVSPELP